MKRVKRSVSLQLSGTVVSVFEMQNLIQGLPEDAVIHIHYTNFDNSPDPRESSYVTLEVRY